MRRHLPSFAMLVLALLRDMICLGLLLAAIFLWALPRS